jgi:hypothetical protein
VTIVQLRIDQIDADSCPQTRERTDQATVEDYAAAYRAGFGLPPVTVFKTAASRYVLADGRHRLATKLLARHKTINCDIRQGELRDARLFAVGANCRHGLRRSNGDKRRGVMMLLMDDEWQGGRTDESPINVACRKDCPHLATATRRRTNGRA